IGRHAEGYWVTTIAVTPNSTAFEATFAPFFVARMRTSAYARRSAPTAATLTMCLAIAATLAPAQGANAHVPTGVVAVDYRTDVFALRTALREACRRFAPRQGVSPPS